MSKDYKSREEIFNRLLKKFDTFVIEGKIVQALKSTETITDLFYFMLREIEILNTPTVAEADKYELWNAEEREKSQLQKYV